MSKQQQEHKNKLELEYFILYNVWQLRGGESGGLGEHSGGGGGSGGSESVQMRGHPKLFSLCVHSCGLSALSRLISRPLVHWFALPFHLSIE